MKKAICIIGMVLCLFVVGSAVATSYFDSSPVTGTIVADSFFKLSLDGSSTQTALVLEPGVIQYYDIVAEVTASATATEEKGTLTITLEAAAEQNIDDVKVEVFVDSSRSDPLMNGTDAVVQKGPGVITISDISTTQTYYLNVILENLSGTEYTATELAAIAGSISIAFVRQTV